MTSRNFIVTTFKQVIAEAHPVGSCVVWYVGDDYAKLTVLRDMWPDAQFAPVAERVAAAAEVLLPLILNLDGHLAGPDLDRDAWDASDLAERSRYNSPFFLEICRAYALMSDPKQGGRILAVCDEDGLAAALFDTATANGFSPAWCGGGVRAVKFRNSARAFLDTGRRFLGELRGAVRRLGAARALRGESPLDDGAVRNVDVWLTIWATDKSFSAGLPYSRDDRFGALPALLREAGLRVGYLVLPLWPERYREIAANALRCAEPTLLLEDGYTFRDALRAGISALRPIRGLRRRLAWNGFDLSPLLRRALSREQVSGRPVQSRLLAGFARMLVRLNAKPKGVLFTYENHSWEKTLSAALRRHLPMTNRVGYNHTPFPPLYVSFHPSAGDIAANRIPDRVIMMGEAGRDTMAARGFPAERLSVGGALRYTDFFETVDKIPQPPAGERVALCCLGVDIDECVELASKAAEAIKAMPEVSLWINFHPIASPEFRKTLKAAILARNASSNIYFEDRSVRVLLPQCHAVLYVDTNAAFEAVAAGRQAVYVGRDTGLPYDKLPAGLSESTLRVEQIVSALRRRSDTGSEAAQAEVRKIFAPLRMEAFLEALGT